MPVHAFVDETKVNGLLVVAAVLQPRDLASARTAMRRLLLPRQSHLHFVKEKAARKRVILDVIAELEVRIDVYDATAVQDQRQARKICLQRIVQDLAAEGAHRLVIEQDDSLVRSDRETLFHAVRANGVTDQLVYEHLSPRTEPLLWIPDAAAWSWVKDASWRRRVQPRVRRVVQI